jgi:hypothetical protein
VEEGRWQFLDGDEVNKEEARLLSLMQMVNTALILTQFFNLPRVWWNEESE